MKKIEPPVVTMSLAILNSLLQIGDAAGWFTRKFMGGPYWMTMTLTILPLIIAIYLIILVSEMKRCNVKRSGSSSRGRKTRKRAATR